MATKAPTPNDYSSLIKSYWDPEKANSFIAWNQRILACAQKIEKQRLVATQKISNQSRTLSSEGNIQSPLEDNKTLFKNFLEELRQIEKDMQPAIELDEQVCPKGIRDGSAFYGDYAAFETRLNALKKTIQNIYKNSLYPFLLTLKNWESGWDPSGAVCKAWDYYKQWQVADPLQEIDQEFPRKVNS